MSSTHATRQRVSRRDRAMQRKYPIEALILEDVVAILAECRPLKPGPTWEILAARLRAAIVIMYRTGVRVSEVLNFSEHDLDADHGTLFVRNGKGGVSRHVGMDEWGWRELGSRGSRQRKPFRSTAASGRDGQDLQKGGGDRCPSSNWARSKPNSAPSVPAAPPTSPASRS